MMQLSSEDALRLNVLLAHGVQAIRIDESSMTVYGLTEDSEARVKLNPNCRDDQYLRGVKELLSGHVLGSPGGYPVFLRRWTRMGQTRDMRLEQLLMLGEPEAVVAVVHAAGLTDDLARRAWWALPTAENARRMLERDCVVNGEMGPVLAEFLIEFLPFEEDPQAVMESVRLVLQPGLVSEQARLRLWQAGRRKAAYLVGFLQGSPDDLPDPLPPRADLAHHRAALEDMVRRGNPCAVQVLRVLSGPGQTFLKVVEEVLRKPPNQDVVNTLLDTLAHYFAAVRPALADAELPALINDAQILCSACPPQDVELPEGLKEVREGVPALRDALRAMVCLSRVGYAVVRPIFSRTTAIGTLMHRKLAPVTGPLLEQLAILRQERA